MLSPALILINKYSIKPLILIKSASRAEQIEFQLGSNSFKHRIFQKYFIALMILASLMFSQSAYVRNQSISLYSKEGSCATECQNGWFIDRSLEIIRSFRKWLCRYKLSVQRSKTMPTQKLSYTAKESASFRVMFVGLMIALLETSLKNSLMHHTHI